MVDPIPAGLHTVTPSITVSPCAEAIDFYVAVFGATERGQRSLDPNGLVGHAEIMIGDSVIMLSDESPAGPTKSPKTAGTSTMALFLYVDNVDELWERAINAGCEVIYPLEVQFYGDKGGRVMDPFGHTWGLGQHVEDVDDEEMARRVAAFYEQEGQ